MPPGHRHEPPTPGLPGDPSPPPARASGRRARRRARRHRLDARVHRARAAHDAGARLLLRRPGAVQELAQHHDDELRRARRRRHRVGAASPTAWPSPRANAWIGGTDQRAAGGRRDRGQGHHPARAVHGLPGHLRHHHRRAHLGRHRRAHALRALPRVHRALDALRLRAGGPLGLGRRLAHEPGRARLRRRHRGAHQRRRVGAGRRAGARARARTTAGRRSCRTTCPSCCSAPGCSGSAGSASTAAARWRPTSSPALAFTNTFLAPMATLVVWVLLDYFRTGRATAVGGATGIVVGLVAITPAAGFVSPTSALLLGAIAAFPSYFAIVARSRTRLDDSLDVFAGHGIGGITGALLTGVFASEGLEPGGQRRPAGRQPRRSSASRRSAWPAPSSTPALVTFVILKLHGPGHRAPRGAARRGPGHGRDPARRRGLHQRRGLDPRHARGGARRRAAPAPSPRSPRRADAGGRST